MTAIDHNLNKVFASAINYDRDLPQYRTRGGFHQRGSVVTTPTAMLADALDRVLAQMQQSGFAFAQVAAVSGSGQQHGSAYWATGARARLRGLRGGPDGLVTQLGPAFSVPDSPIWRDSSTTAQCRALEAAVGGPQALADISGSRAYERFTANQVHE